MRWDRGTPPVGSHFPHNLRLCKGPSSDTVTHDSSDVLATSYLLIHRFQSTSLMFPVPPRHFLHCFFASPVFEVEKQVWSRPEARTSRCIWQWHLMMKTKNLITTMMTTDNIDFSKKTIKSLQLGQQDKTFQSLTFGWRGWDFSQRLQRLTFATLQQISIRVWTASHSSFSFDGFYMAQVPIRFVVYWAYPHTYTYRLQTYVFLAGPFSISFITALLKGQLQTSGPFPELVRRLEDWDLRLETFFKNLHPLGISPSLSMSLRKMSARLSRLESR